jgi:hypothetical protein
VPHAFSGAIPRKPLSRLSSDLRVRRPIGAHRYRPVVPEHCETDQYATIQDERQGRSMTASTKMKMAVLALIVRAMVNNGCGTGGRRNATGGKR